MTNQPVQTPQVPQQAQQPQSKKSVWRRVVLVGTLVGGAAVAVGVTAGVAGSVVMSGGAPPLMPSPSNGVGIV